MLNINLIPYDGNEWRLVRDAERLYRSSAELISLLNETKAKANQAISVLNNQQRWDAMPDGRLKDDLRTYHDLIRATAEIGNTIAHDHAFNMNWALMTKLEALQDDIEKRELDPLDENPSWLVRLAKNNRVFLSGYLGLAMKQTAASRIDFRCAAADAVCGAVRRMKAGTFAFLRAPDTSEEVRAFDPSKFFFIPRSLLTPNGIGVFGGAYPSDSAVYRVRDLAQDVALTELEKAYNKVKELLAPAVQMVAEARSLGELNEPQFTTLHRAAKNEKRAELLQAQQNDKRCGVVRITTAAALMELRCAEAQKALSEAIENLFHSIVLPPTEHAIQPFDQVIACANCVTAWALLAGMALQRKRLRELAEMSEEVCVSTLNDVFVGEQKLPDDFASSRFSWNLARYPSERFDD
jgi:hypothetical protein